MVRKRSVVVVMKSIVGVVETAREIVVVHAGVVDRAGADADQTRRRCGMGLGSADGAVMPAGIVGRLRDCVPPATVFTGGVCTAHMSAARVTGAAMCPRAMCPANTMPAPRCVPTRASGMTVLGERRCRAHDCCRKYTEGNNQGGRYQPTMPHGQCAPGSLRPVRHRRGGATPNAG
ncbi:MAG: hypothetical protein ACOY71_08930 [Gemmatimonadota bacterium]